MMIGLSGRICPGCSDVVLTTMADEPYVILCGGNCEPHELRYDAESLCEGHGWTPAHLRCKDTALVAMRALMQ